MFFVLFSTSHSHIYTIYTPLFPPLSPPISISVAVSHCLHIAAKFSSFFNQVFYFARLSHGVLSERLRSSRVLGRVVKSRVCGCVCLGLLVNQVSMLCSSHAIFTPFYCRRQQPFYLNFNALCIVFNVWRGLDSENRFWSSVCSVCVVISPVSMTKVFYVYFE